MKWGEQARVFRMIPGLEAAEFVRFGMIHRNTYINGADRADRHVADRERPDLFFAGQVSGVEGYVESAASGLIAGRNAARWRWAFRLAPPRTTAIGALGYYVSTPIRALQPSNITFGIMPPLDSRRRAARNASWPTSQPRRSRTSTAVAGRRDGRVVVAAPACSKDATSAQFLEFLRFNRNVSPHTVAGV